MSHTKRFPRDSRIRKKVEFENCQSKGKRFHSRRFVLFLLRDGAPPARLGLVVTRDTGGAVVRNRWRRMIRECFRNHREELALTGDFVVMVRRSVKEDPKAPAREELLNLFSSARHA